MVEKKPEKHSTLQNSFVASPKNLLILLARKQKLSFSKFFLLSDILTITKKYIRRQECAFKVPFFCFLGGNNDRVYLCPDTVLFVCNNCTSETPLDSELVYIAYLTTSAKTGCPASKLQYNQRIASSLFRQTPLVGHHL